MPGSRGRHPDSAWTRPRSSISPLPEDCGPSGRQNSQGRIEEGPEVHGTPRKRGTGEDPALRNCILEAGEFEQLAARIATQSFRNRDQRLTRAAGRNSMGFVRPLGVEHHDRRPILMRFCRANCRFLRWLSAVAAVLLLAPGSAWVHVWTGHLHGFPVAATGIADSPTGAVIPVSPCTGCCCCSTAASEARVTDGESPNPVLRSGGLHNGHDCWLCRFFAKVSWQASGGTPLVGETISFTGAAPEPPAALLAPRSATARGPPCHLPSV